MDVVEYRGFHINVYQDEDSISPREYDNLGHMICWHSRYRLSDSDQDKRSVEDMEIYFKETHALVLSLYLYDHGGITMSTSPFSCPWDSGKVGYYYVTLDEVKKEYNCKAVTPTIRKRAFKVMEGEVEVYDQFLTGQVYGYTVEETDDSCWGFFGDTGYMLDVAKGNIDRHIRAQREKHVEQVRQWIKSKVGLLYRQPGELSEGVRV